METINSTNFLSADKAETDPQRDALGYAPFAKHLANSIHRMTPRDGLVAAIYGPWGSGKSTIINFTVYNLQQLPENERPIIVHFNPWWFSGHEDLAKRFFGQLQAVLNNRHTFDTLRNYLSDFAEMIAEIPIPYASSGKAVAKIARPVQKDVFELKEAISKELVAKGLKILVVIDDIDRLTGEEIRQIFRVIKAVGDFPNVIYLLAFDKEIAVKAVEQMQNLPGESYLEKIIQVPFELPLPDKPSLRQMLAEKLDAILAGTPDELVNESYFVNVYAEGIDHFINTPRDIVRLTNTIGVTYTAVKGEVNAVDFLAIETLRVFLPKLYDVIRQNQDMFAGYATSGGYSSSRYQQDALKAFHESYMEHIPNQSKEFVQQLLMRIFPKLQSVWRNTWYGPESAADWRSQLRISSPDIFSVYFRLSIPQGQISNAAMANIVGLAVNAQSFATILLDYSNQKRADGTTMTRAVLARLEDYTKSTIPLTAIPEIIEAFSTIGDDLARKDEKRTMFDFGIELQLDRITFQLLRRFEEPQRHHLLMGAIQKGRAVAYITRLVSTLVQQHDKVDGETVPEEENLISLDHLFELQHAALQQIREAAQHHTLLYSPDLRRTLYFWQRWANEREAAQWVESIANDDENLAVLLEKFLSRTFSQTIGDAAQHTHYRLDPEWFRSFIDPEYLMQQVSSLAMKDHLTDNQHLAINRIVVEAELRRSGKTPDHPFD